jgi:hypothetical protein
VASPAPRAGEAQALRSGATAAQRIDPVALDPKFVEDTTQRLLVYVGPIGRVIARKAAQQARSRQEFVALVASHIGTQDRGAFLRDIGADA